jgi:hypothetical protein
LLRRTKRGRRACVIIAAKEKSLELAASAGRESEAILDLFFFSISLLLEDLARREWGHPTRSNDSQSNAVRALCTLCLINLIASTRCEVDS